MDGLYVGDSVKQENEALAGLTAMKIAVHQQILRDMVTASCQLYERIASELQAAMEKLTPERFALLEHEAYEYCAIAQVMQVQMFASLSKRLLADVDDLDTSAPNAQSKEDGHA